MFDDIAELGETATLHQILGYVSTGGHHMPVFDDGFEIACIIRPWQSDIMHQGDSGMTGHTPGVKIYTDASTDIVRDDRLLYGSNEYRIQNPQYDQMFGMVRWDGRTDDRNFRLEGDLAEGHEITPVDREARGEP